MNTLNFEIHNQTLVRVDSQDVINKNKNVYKCTFTFDEESEWIPLNKFVLFTDGWGNSRTQHLGNNSNILSCLVPDSMLQGSYFKISVYAGDLITTNNISINLIQSGYNRHHNPHHCGCNHDSKDIFVEIFDILDNTVDSIVYDNNTLHLFSRDTLLESIYLPFLEESEIRELVKDLTNDFIIPLASHDNDGLLSKDDKVKLDSVESGANCTIIDSSLDAESVNPVENRVIMQHLTNQDNRIDSFINHQNTNADEVYARLDGFNEELLLLNSNINDKEDKYDYVKRLDDLILDLITKGE